MKKNTLNFIVDVITLIAILAMIGTGLVLYFTLPPGSGGKGLLLWGLGRHEWGDLHFWAAVGLAVLLVLHVALHWAWVCGTISRLAGAARRPRSKGRENLIGLVFLIIVGGGLWGFVAVANDSVTQSDAAAARHDAEEANANSAEHGERGGRGQGRRRGQSQH